MAVMFFHIP